jgi:hypothetical protein
MPLWFRPKFIWKLHQCKKRGFPVEIMKIPCEDLLGMVRFHFTGNSVHMIW